MSEEKKVPAPAPVKTPEAKKAAKVETKKYTYIGDGEDSPNQITFMGKVDFFIGKPVDIPVTDEFAKVLEKIDGHRCFVEGEATADDAIERAKQGKEKADAQRAKDKETNKLAQKQLQGK